MIQKLGLLPWDSPPPPRESVDADGRGVRTKFSRPHGFTKNPYPWCSAGAASRAGAPLQRGSNNLRCIDQESLHPEPLFNDVKTSKL